MAAFYLTRTGAPGDEIPLPKEEAQHALIEYKPEFKMRDHFQNEIDAFVDCVKTRKKLPSHIDTVIITARMMQAIYDSSAAHQEQKLD